MKFKILFEVDGRELANHLVWYLTRWKQVKILDIESENGTKWRVKNEG